MKGRRVVLALVGLAAVGAAATAATIGFGGREQASGSERVAAPATATVTRTTLRDSETVDGTLAYGREYSLVNRRSGTITSVPDVGVVVRRGQALYTVDNEPVLLLYGALPAYRPLAVGTEGADVRQFEQELAALGYTGFTVDDEYTSSTADAVERWQKALGLDQTGVVELGRVVFGPGEIRIAAENTGVGEAAQPGQTVYSYTGTVRQVTVTLDMGDQRLAKKDAKVDVELPDGKKVGGTVNRVVTVIEPAAAPNEDDETKIEVTVGLADAAAAGGLDQASVRVSFTVSERKDVLTVPVAALLALAEGGYGLQIVDSGGTRIIAVTTGLFADGRVEVSADGLAEGMTVGMPS